LVAVGASGLLLWSRMPSDGNAAFDRVRPGMTLDEVVAAIGRPPDDGYTPSLAEFQRISTKRYFSPEDAPPLAFEHQWPCGDGELLVVAFGRDGRAVRYWLYALEWAPLSEWFQATRDWLGF
jgi:hypothetical protein